MPTESHAPNIVLLLIESFSPVPAFLKKDVLDSANETIIHGPMFTPKVLPNLNGLQQRGVNFPQLSSHGLPTIIGWLTLLIGAMPNKYQNNII